MQTRFDLVGRFCNVSRAVAGGEPTTTTKEIVLQADMFPSQCCCGKTVLAYQVSLLSKPHIKTSGLERQWLINWDLREKKVPDNYGEERAAA